MRKKSSIKRTIKAKIDFVQKNERGSVPILKPKTPNKKIERIKTETSIAPILKQRPITPSIKLDNLRKEIINKNTTQEHRKKEEVKHNKETPIAVVNTNYNDDNPNRKKIPESQLKHYIPVVLKDYGIYEMEENVDYDVVICVSSFERYTKARRILRQLHTQESKYRFKFCLMNDSSTDERYDNLKNEFPDIDYIKNDINGGKKEYWKTVNKLWSVGSKYNCHAFLQIDDDFILCNNFLDRLLDEFFKKKVEDNHYMAFTYHLYGYDKNTPLPEWWRNNISVAIDGGTMFDNRFLKLINHRVDIGEKIIAAHTSTFFWDTIVGHFRELGVRVYRMPKSLAWHDGNFDSKLNFQARKTKKSYTKEFIDGDNAYDFDIDLSYITF